MFGSRDGCRLLTVPKDGRTFKGVPALACVADIFYGQGAGGECSWLEHGGGSVALGASSWLSAARKHHDLVFHMHNLWLGVTNGVVEGIVVGDAGDERPYGFYVPC